MTICKKLNYHLLALCKEANKKLCVLWWIRFFVRGKEIKILINTLTYSSVNHDSLVWCFYPKKTEEKKDNIQERFRRIVMSDNSKSHL